MTTAKDINKLFREAGRTLTCVESFTGGLFAAEITAVPGASHFFKGGMVTYFTEEKVRLLDIPYESIDKFGVVSRETAAAMAGRGEAVMCSDYCISFTGNAGPDAMENKPAGLVYIGISAYGHATAFEFQLEGDRDEIRRQAIAHGLEILKFFLEEFK